MFSRFGVPKEILTDQGTNFMSGLLKEIYRMMGIEAIRTSSYHPQTDGLVERYNQTAQRPKSWDKLLPLVMFAYREVPQESTVFSPFELISMAETFGDLSIY